MKFKKAVEDTPDLSNAYSPGLQALSRADAKHIAAEDPKRLTGSVNLDEALKNSQPDASRWDYAVGHRPRNLKGNKEMVYWVEIHSANDREVKVVLAKLQWLKSWLAINAPELNSLQREFIWLSSGKTSFTLSAPQKKTFALQGLQHKGRLLRISNNAGA